MEVITGEKNRLITECGHVYHTDCLMKNVVKNGIQCPCCRKDIAETTTHQQPVVVHNQQTLTVDDLIDEVQPPQNPQSDNESLPVSPLVIELNNILVENGITMEMLLYIMLCDGVDNLHYERLRNKVFSTLRGHYRNII